MTGCLWKMHALTGNTTWSKAATAKLPDSEPVATYTGVGDGLWGQVGMLCMRTCACTQLYG